MVTGHQLQFSLRQSLARMEAFMFFKDCKNRSLECIKNKQKYTLLITFNAGIINELPIGIVLQFFFKWVP